jgi:hypothetical protein
MTGFLPRLLSPLAAGLAVALAATSLTGVLSGPRWWGFVVLTTAVVVGAGVLLRWLRMPSIVVAAGQLTALAGLVTAVFTSSGWLAVVPGPAAATQLRAVLARAAQQIRVGLPPLPESTELLCLVVVAVGLVAVVVHTLAVSAAAPACAGLVLLCVVTVPAVVSDQLLPWWSFALGALGFALLLAADGWRRQLEWGECAGSGGYLSAAPGAIAVTASAMAVALFVGATVTTVGTTVGTTEGGTGRSASTGAGRSGNGMGLNPFTALRGQLSSGDGVALFWVRGLKQRTYLRALTLSRFTTRVGWQPGPLDGVVLASPDKSADKTEPLPLPVGVSTPVSGSTLRVQIEPINYVDNWLPTFGYPLALAGIGPDWNYDPDALTVFSARRQRAQPYTEWGVLPAPDPRLLRAAGPAGGAPFDAVDPRYLDAVGVDHRVRQLATQVTAGTRTAFDATVALNQWFTQPSNGFRYDVRTAAGNSGDALVDFLFTGRQGYCEQFASAMAIMLRTLHVPARVAVGFTPGTVTGGSRLITTDDAHAWVEAWFPGVGWLPFDPTPLSDGRTVAPDYGGTSPTLAGPPLPAGPPVASTAPPAPDPLTGPAPHPGSSEVDLGTRIGLSVIGLLGLGVLALTPLGVRAIRRRRRLRLVGTGGPRAVCAAWEEVLAEFADRGVVPPGGQTVRATAELLAHEPTLNEPARVALGILVSAVERSWYAGGGTARLSGTSDRELCAAVDAVRSSLARGAQPSPMARLFPRSVLRRSTPGRSILGRQP